MPTKRLKIGEVYRDVSGQHQWRLKATNGKIVATDGGQQFNNITGACKGLTHALDLNPGDFTKIRLVEDGHVFYRYEIRRVYA